MALKEKASAVWSELKQKLQDKRKPTEGEGGN